MIRNKGPRWPPGRPRAGGKPSSSPSTACSSAITTRLIRIHLDHITFLDRAVAAVEDGIDAALDAILAAWGISADGVPSPSPGPDAAALTAAERLAEIHMLIT